MVARSPAPSVLVADAEYYICRVLEAKLSKDNRFQVVTATTAQAALQAAYEQPFDVVLWEILRLHGTSEMLPRVRALCPRAALFLMTTDDRPQPDPDFKRLDYAGVLVKPFGLDTLVDQLYRALADPVTTPNPAPINLSRTGQLLTLISPGGRCMTRVLDRSLDTFEVVGAPRVETPPDFTTGLRVRVQVKGEDALYSFDSRLLRSLPHPVFRWELRLPRLIRREQRRKHPRVPIEIAAVLTGPPQTETPVSEPVSPEQPPQPAIATGITDDLSLGGFAIVSDLALPVGTEVHFDIGHGEARAMEGQGRIVRIQPVSASPTTPATTLPRYRIAVQFTELDPVTRRHLRSLLGSSS
ncbi:MAG TPA: PilZ domain-containing protein [Chthonomonadaceae bacterium]|nr:PilZ domain-containing protein [Chthonomonadaceae bacterium]